MTNNIVDVIRDLAGLFPVLLLVFTFRGFFRALVAKWMGDDTAYEAGFVSLNPFVHVNVFVVMVTLLMLFVFGIYLDFEYCNFI